MARCADIIATYDIVLAYNDSTPTDWDFLTTYLLNDSDWIVFSHITCSITYTSVYDDSTNSTTLICKFVMLNKCVHTIIILACPYRYLLEILPQPVITKTKLLLYYSSRKSKPIIDDMLRDPRFTNIDTTILATTTGYNFSSSALTIINISPNDMHDWFIGVMSRIILSIQQ